MSNWTATTNTEWIYFDSSRSKEITGTGGENITIYVDHATSPTDEAKGSITIITETGVIEKEITRCVPTIVKEIKTLSCEINGCNIVSNSENNCDITVGPCAGGTSSQSDYNAINVNNIILITEQILSEGAPISTNQPLTLNDVNITYTTEDGITISSLSENNGKSRDIVVTVTYKLDRSVYVETTIHQEGIKTNEDEYDESKFVTTGYSSSSVDYIDFNFISDCIDAESLSCEEGTFQFFCSGTKVTTYGAKTGLTVCGKSVTIERTGPETSETISNSDVIYSVTPSDYGKFNGNVLTYYKNESRTQSRPLEITATLNSDNQIVATTSTTFTVIPGQCGNPLYLHITAASLSVPYSSSTLEIRYYLTESETDSETNIITDEDIISCIGFQCPSGLKSCGTQVQDSNGVYKRTVEFYKNQVNGGEEGVNWKFSATCENAVVSPVILNIYQASKYENIIPNCDYFVFKYNWLESDGKDLDSLTHITHVPNLKASDGTSVSGKTVGYGALNSVIGQSNLLYLRHGGDNRCSGAEGAIICLKNILNSEQISNEDVIFVDIYACWYNTRGNGNMNIAYEQFTGYTGNYSEEIKEVIHDDCPPNTYKTFETVEGKSSVITGETTDTINVKAYGTSNYIMAKNVNCIDGAYTHVLRLKYNVESKITSLQYFTDNGINTYDLKYYININGEMKRTNYRYTATTNAATSYTYSNVYIKQEYGSDVYTIYPFESDDDIIEITEYSRESGAGSWNFVQSQEIKKANVGTQYNLTYITNFKITKNSDKTISISFDYAEASTQEREFDIHFKQIYGKGVLECNTFYNANRIEVYQIP